jgi:hypothetical protein
MLVQKGTLNHDAIPKKIIHKVSATTSTDLSRSATKVRHVLTLGRKASPKSEPIADPCHMFRVCLAREGKNMTRVIKFSLLGSIIELFFSTFRLFFMDLIPFFGAFILVGIDIFYIAIFIKIIIYFFKNLKQKLVHPIVPIIIMIVSLGITAFIINFDVERKMTFFITLKSRQEVVNLINKKELLGEGSVKLPKKYASLTKDGLITIKRVGKSLYVEFYIYTFFPGDFDGVIYSSNNKIPKKTLFFWDSSFLEYSNFYHNWFWFSHS